MELENGIRRQLGTIMLEEGFLTETQLDEALAEQHRTSRPLGQVLVELGFVSAGAVANALADQHGGLLRTEYGVSAGLVRVAPPSEPKPEAAPAAAGDGERRRLVGELEALREQCETLRRGVALLGSELERLRDSI